MTTHELGTENGYLTLFGELLVMRYDAGDVDLIDASAPNMEHLRRALFDFRECDDRVAYGDTFSLHGQIIEV